MTRKLVTPKLLVISLIVQAFVFSFSVSRIDASNEEAAASAISEAEGAVAWAYEAVLEAEQAGANVSSLLAGLNKAATLLAKAQIAFRLGDFNETIFSANPCCKIGDEVWLDALELQVEAQEARVMDSRLAIAGSIFGIVVVVLASFWGWRVFKRHYIRQALRMKPDVANDES